MTSTGFSVPLLIVLAMLNGLTPFSIDMYLSAFPEMAVEFGTTASGVQLSLTAFLIGLASGQLVIGTVSDRYGRRVPLLVGTAACLVASLACAVAPSIAVLVALRFVQGFTGAAGVVIGRAVIADRVEGAAAARVFAVMMLISVLAPITAPMLGGGIVTWLGWRAVFVALAVLNLLLLFGVLAFVEESLPPERRRPGGLGALAASARSVLTNRHYLGYALTMAFTSGGLFAYISASPFVLQNIIGLSPGRYAVTFGCCALCIGVSGLVSARLVRRFPPRRVLIGGVCGMVVMASLLLLAVTAGGVQPVATIGLMAGFLASIGFVYSNATALATTEVRHAAGTGSAVLGLLQYGTGAVTPPLVGLAGSASAVPMGVVMGGAAALAALSLAVLTRGHRPDFEPVPVEAAEPAGFRGGGSG
ncbi:multidrug effflux MFS transporter [uncultured Mycolicibacterium sp.]|uniref:multidrug effflux MFS transporter n=1 Tax=uncultured Mycolicibacterium sp. TaxID=2320817 RepID=UPI00261785AD|nr:multidrug effflux MFS transporter [uncultured Mycolicibacterium sp.]